MNNYQEFKIIDNITKLIESSFGIHGKLKLISQVFDHKNDEGENDNVVNSTQKIIFTNDGLMIFKSLNNDSPYYKIILQQSNYIKNRFGCGVSQYIILTNNILKRSIKLINNKGSSSSSTSIFSINQILNIFQECRLFIKNNFNEKFIINLKDEIFGSSGSSGGKNDQLLESIIKTNLSKNILSVYFKRISKIFKKLIKILPNLDKNKIKIKTIISSNEDDNNNNNEDEDEKEEEEEKDDDNDEIEIKLLNGILIKSKFSFAGRDKLIKVIENPKILLLDYEIELKHQKEFANIEISNVNDYLEFINAEKSLISKQLENIYNLNINLILNKKVIGDLAIQEFVKRSNQNNKINCIGSINNINEFEFIKKSIGGNTQSSLQNLSLDSSFYGTCKKYKQIIIGKKSYELFEGCQFSDTQTIILKGSSKKFLKEAKLGLESLLTIFRSIIIDDDFKFVGASSNFEFIIINLLNELIKNKQNSSPSSSSLSTNLIKEVLIIKSLQKSIKDIIKLLLLNSNLNLDLIDQLFQINNNDNNNSCINIEENKIGNILDLNLFEPKSMKLSILNSSIETSCILLKTITT
ncbi:hypothetical protein ACTFIW_002571 [Dictyostelium discoideum]